MSPVAAGLALACFSALTTSLAHALLKSGGDKLAVQAWVRLTELALAAPLALLVGWPPTSLWPWLLGNFYMAGDEVPGLEMLADVNEVYSIIEQQIRKNISPSLLQQIQKENQEELN